MTTHLTADDVRFCDEAQGHARFVKALRASRPPSPVDRYAPHETALRERRTLAWHQWLADVYNIGEALGLTGAKLVEFIKRCEGKE